MVGGSYSRLSGALSAFDARTVWLASDLIWNGLPNIVPTHIGIWDAQFNGHLLSYGGLPLPYPNVPQGGSFELAANTYAISVGLAA